MLYDIHKSLPVPVLPLRIQELVQCQYDNGSQHLFGISQMSTIVRILAHSLTCLSVQPPADHFNGGLQDGRAGDNAIAIRCRVVEIRSGQIVVVGSLEEPVDFFGVRIHLGRGGAGEDASFSGRFGSLDSAQLFCRRGRDGIFEGWTINRSDWDIDGEELPSVGQV